jgi:hypothetical protein
MGVKGSEELTMVVKDELIVSVGDRLTVAVKG